MLNIYIHLWHVSYSQCKGDEREERAEICKTKEAGGFWCSVCEVNADDRVKRSEQPGRIIDVKTGRQEKLSPWPRKATDLYWVWIWI